MTPPAAPTPYSPAAQLAARYYFSPARRAFNPFINTKYQEMGELAATYTMVITIDSMTIFVLTIKSLKYFTLQKDLMLLQKTLGQAIADLAVFIAMLVALLVGFIIMATNIFGMQASGFKDPWNTLGTLFLILLGEFDFEEMADVDYAWALIFFLFFVIFMFFIVLNIFLAILNDA